MSTKNYLSTEYFPVSEIPDDHWSIKLDPKYGIGTVNVLGNHNLWVKINPTDHRGYRIIVQYIGKDIKDIKSTLNRKWTIEETEALFKVGAVMNQFYYNLDLTPQIYFAGNNSMELVNSKIIIGRKEPAMLHIHILGRGNPNEYHIQNSSLKLDCPEV